ncbi:winged helix-turn-helix domain-containing protein, partial [Tabrizicola sp.]|uniref:winged helix-turn-helix domain-containing protein n=1 Tax=Tabrizicola sp. TaxID=2005166 RepID=UPI00286A85CC
MNQSAHHQYEFGSFHHNARERLLQRDGVTITLTPKAFDLLLALIERHGRLVEKEELFQAVWPDTLVEESNLSSNIALIRKALGDGENGLKVIETVPKRGYRFVAEVREVKPALAEEELPSSPTIPAVPPVHRTRRFVLPLAVIVVLAAGFGVWFLFRRTAPLPPMASTPFSSFQGNEMQPSFSPDGNQIAFVWEGEQQNNQDIYVKQPGNETLLRLTTNPAAELWPCWSPDGRYIAFTRERADGAELCFIPSLGGAERSITRLSPIADAGMYQASWSPDSEWLAIQDRNAPQEPPKIFLVARETGEKRQLTSPPAAAHADRHPAISPDGKTVAFIRFSSSGVGDVYLVPTAGGEARRLTFGNTNAASPVWTPDGRDILFLGGSTLYSLSRVSAAGGKAVPVEGVGQNLSSFAVSRQGQRLAWTQTINDMNIWQMELSEQRKSPQSLKPWKPLIASTRRDASPDLSPDGKRIVFASNRSGLSQIWVADGTGEHPVQLTTFTNGFTGSPRWSPDGRQIVFDARPADSSDIYVINAEGGPPRRLTADSAEDAVPSWSRDGQWIYFTSKRSGSPQIWRMPASGGQANQVTEQGGVDSLESPDGLFLYYTKARYAPG